MREEASSWYMQILLVILALSFVLFFDLGGGPNQLGSGEIASVGSEKLTAQEFGIRYQNMMSMFNAQGMGDANELIQNLVKDNVMRQFINEKVGYLEASKLGFQPSPEAVKKNIQDQFTPEGGSFSFELYNNVVRNRLRQTPVAFEEGEAKKDVAQRYQDWLSETIVASPLALEKDYIQKNDKRSISYVSLALEDVQDKLYGQTEPSQEDIQAYYQAQKAEFMTQEQRAFDLLSFKKKEDPNQSNDQFYQEAKAILNLVKQDQSVDYQTYAASQDQITFQHTSNVDYNSEVPNVSSEDLAMILNATLSLEKDQQSDILQSRDGNVVYLAKLKDKVSAQQQTLAQATPEIQAMLTKENKQRLFQDYISNLHKSWKESSRGIDALAATHGFEVKKSEAFVQDGAGNIPSLGPVKALSDEVFGMQSKTFLSKPYENSGTWILAQVSDIAAVDLEKFQSQREKLWEEGSQDVAFNHLEQLTEHAKKSLKVNQADLSKLKF